MTQVTINDTAYDCQVGERLVDVARRNGAHVGFVCDGLLFFLFESNLCRVVKGAENLSPPTDLEKAWLQQSWLDAGYRMACEAYIQGGSVEVISRAEELRRQTVAIFSPPEGTKILDNAGTLASSVGRSVVNQVIRIPFNFAGAIPIWVQRIRNRQIAPICLPLLPGIIRDGGKVIGNMVGSYTGAKEEA